MNPIWPRFFIVTALILPDFNVNAAGKLRIGFKEVTPNNPYSFYIDRGPLAGTHRWLFECPQGHKCQLTCMRNTVPKISSPTLLVSVKGDIFLRNADTYSIKKEIRVLSDENKIAIGFKQSCCKNRVESFKCDVHAVEQKLPDRDVRCRCGDRRPTIINEYPSMVGLVDRQKQQIVCGGVIISNWHVLTAAHCVVDQEVFKMAVVVGEYNVNLNDSLATKLYTIANYINHERFDRLTNDYDISLVRVVEPIVFGLLVGPVCLPFKFKNEALTSADVTLLGWGILYPNGPPSPILQQVEVKVVGTKYCNIFDTKVTDRQICTYSQGKDACQYDSGGPVYYTDPDSKRLFNIGIISHGWYCGEFPAVQTKVSSFVDWIIEKTAGVHYCMVP